MNTLKKMRRLCRSWYMMVFGLCLAPALLLVTEAQASENRGISTQRRLAEYSRLMYGLEGEATATTKPRWQKKNSTHGKQALRTQTKKRYHAGHVRKSSKLVVYGASQRQLQKAKGQRVGNKNWLRRGQQRSAASHAARRSRSANGFVSQAEQRMGTFLGPVNGTAVSRSSGLFYRVAENADVRASSRGQVVYAGWFRGYGLLTIVNHGGRVYSLYGHNRDLLVAKGDAVEPGQIIAKSGKTGTVDGVPGLYFEIRKGNRPENPRRWLARDRAHSDKMASLMH
ncbi:MAG: M23 family metallopeptidase [Magnetococcales bacterium]|nr:M23 family metallopeptidase [Magnetococcales bacterium]